MRWQATKELTFYQLLLAPPPPDRPPPQLPPLDELPLPNELPPLLEELRVSREMV